MGYGEIYKTTWWGSPVQDGWGGIYYDLSVTSAVPNLLESLQARATYYENATGTTTILTALENCETMSNLLEKASILTTPTAYDNGKILSVKPNTSVGDFDFTRNSSATRVNAQGLVEDVQILSSNLVSNGDFSQEGSELVTNGDFSNGETNWDFGGDWTLVNGTAEILTSTNSFLIQSNVIDLSVKTYKIQYEVVSTNGSNLRLSGGNSAFGTVNLDSSTIGVKTIYLQSNGTTRNLQFNQNAFRGSIDNVSVKEVGQDWTLGTGWSIGDGKAESNGSQSTISDIEQNITLNQGSTYIVKFDLIRSAGTLYPKVGNTTGTGLTSTQSVSQNIVAGSSNKLELRADANFIGSITNISVIEITDDTNLPRIDYTDGVGSWLFEPQSTNLIPYSEDFTQWNKSNASLINTISSTVVSPDGVSYANKLYPIGSATSSFIIQGGSGNCFSVFVKKGERRWVLIYGGFSNSNVWFDSENGVFGNIFDNVVTVESFGNDWYKIKILWAQNSSHVRIYNTDSGTSTQSTGNGTDGLYIWGAQLEVQSFATSYIPTEGSIKTRLQDAAFGAGSSDLINSTEGVLYAEILRRQEINDNYDLITLNNGASNSDANSVSIGFDINSDDFFIRVKANGVSVFFNSNISASANQFHKVALKYKSGDCAVWIDGVEQGTGTTTFTFTQTLDNLTFDKGNSTLNFYGKTKALAVFKEALTDEELTCLTTI